jgi:hypothetical protein
MNQAAAWLKYQWRRRRAKTVAGAIVAELDYINAQLSKLQRRKMDDTNVMRTAALFPRRNFLMTYSRSDYEE